jgi:FKBP-type peptidyl-prolyl cis-trans isomerase FkpA
MKNLIILLSLLFAFSACETYSENDKLRFDKEIKAFIKKKKLSLEKTTSGLYKKTVSKGTGSYVQYTDSVSITYQGKLLNGQVFDYQVKPQTFAIRDLIAGWKEALLSAKKGDEIIMIIPPQLGYGTNKLEDIPINSILYFEMKIVDIK